MRYNAIGDLAGGVIEVNVNRMRLSRGTFGSGTWVDHDTIIANADPAETDKSWALYAFRRNTEFKTAEKWDPRGASTAGGGGGNWAVTLQSNPKQTYGVIAGKAFDSTKGDTLPDGTPYAQVNVLDGHDDGRLIFTSPDFLSLGVLTADGKSIKWWYVGPHTNNSATRLIASGFLYMDASLSHTIMLQLDDMPARAVQLLDGPFDPDSFVYNGQRWFIYHNEATWLHAEGSKVGYKFAASYGPAIFVTADGMAQVALTPSAGEVSSSIVLVPAFKLGEGMIDLVSPIVVPKIGPFNHNVSIGPFFPDTDCPGDMCVVANQQDFRTAAPWKSKLIMTASSLAVAVPPKDRFAGIYNETKSGITRALATQYGVPLFVCQDNGSKFDAAMLAQMVTSDWALLECYMLAGETILDAITRIESNLVDLLARWSGRVGIVWQDYTQAWKVPVQRLMDFHAHLTDLVNKYARVEFIGPFA